MIPTSIRNLGNYIVLAGLWLLLGVITAIDFFVDAIRKLMGARP